jgi:hypothetical protein
MLPGNGKNNANLNILRQKIKLHIQFLPAPCCCETWSIALPSLSVSVCGCKLQIVATVLSVCKVLEAVTNTLLIFVMSHRTGRFLTAVFHSRPSVTKSPVAATGCKCTKETEPIGHTSRQCCMRSQPTGSHFSCLIVMPH